MEQPIYDRIGQGYADKRMPEPQIARAMELALQGSQAILNVGAGSGSYEPQGRDLVALEPSRKMIGQRPIGSRPVVQGAAENLPFADATFDLCMGVLTIHHWADPVQGLREMQRVARKRIVLLTWLPACPDFWLYEYFPEIWRMDLDWFWREERYAALFPKVHWEPVLIPRECRDGFLASYWARPQAYLDKAARAAISSFSKFDASAGLTRLQADLQSGSWEDRFAEETQGDAKDLGYRLMIADL